MDRKVTGESKDAAERLLEKLRGFIARDLDDEERALLASLLAPGVASAHEDVSGFGLTGWSPANLPEALVRAMDASGVRVEGLGL